MDTEYNSFGFLRLLFAVAVLYFHSYILGGFGNEPFGTFLKNQESVGSMAVMGFFVISGFLVTKSLINSGSVLVYSFRRCLRVLPGFWVCLLVTACIFAPVVFLLERHTLSGFPVLGPNGSLDYIRNNFFLLMHQYTIGNLLANNPLKNIFNGSLWTIFPEAKAYLFLGILGVLKLHKSKTALLLIFFAMWSLIFFNIPVHSASNKFLRLVIDPVFLLYGTYFFAGAVCFLFRDLLPLNNYWFYLCVGLAVLAATLGFLHQTLPILGPYAVLWLAQKLPFRNFANKGDLSYGVYIYAFPVQQLLSLVHINRNFFIYFGLSLLVTLVLAVLSWNWVEKPALRLKTWFTANNRLK